MDARHTFRKLATDEIKLAYAHALIKIMLRDESGVFMKTFAWFDAHSRRPESQADGIGMRHIGTQGPNGWRFNNVKSADLFISAFCMNYMGVNDYLKFNPHVSL